MKQRIRDRRRLPFFQVTKADLTALAGACEASETNVRLASVRSVYFALLEITNDERSDTAEVTRKELGERSGVSTRTVYDAVQVIETAGLLEVEKKEGFADIWVLISVEDRVGNDCQGGRQPLPGSIYREEDQEGRTPCSPPGTPCQKCGTPREPSGRCPVCTVFEHWQRVMGHRNAVLDDGRVRTIRRALKIATVDECRRAISGCSRSDFHMARGEHKGGTRYDSLSLILRNREQIEKFMALTPVTADSTSADGFTSSAQDAKIREHKRNVLRAFDLAGSAEAQRSGDESEHWLAQHGIRVVRDAGTDGTPKRPTFAGPDTSGG